MPRDSRSRRHCLAGGRLLRLLAASWAIRDKNSLLSTTEYGDLALVTHQQVSGGGINYGDVTFGRGRTMQAQFFRVLVFLLGLLQHWHRLVSRAGGFRCVMGNAGQNPS